MSKFNEDMICCDCKDEERGAPNYHKADEAEVAAVRAGVRNFPGIGLAAEDLEYLAQRRKERHESRGVNN